MYSFFNLDVRWRWWLGTPRSGRFTSWNDQVPSAWEDEWAPGPVWTTEENLASTVQDVASGYTD